MLASRAPHSIARVDGQTALTVLLTAVSASCTPSFNELRAELRSAIDRGSDSSNVDPRAMSTPALVAHIISRHHEYLRQTLPNVLPLAEKVARVHGDKNPSPRDLHRSVVELSEAILPHLDQEEQVLFPAIMAREPSREVVRRELEAMFADHLTVGALLGRMREAASGFALPEWACNSYRALFGALEKIEVDILRHVHLENHVLMPRFAS